MINQTIALSKGNNKPMSASVALKVALPIKDKIDGIKSGKATPTDVFHILEFFTLVYGALCEALGKTKASAQHLLKERCEVVKKGCDVAFSVYKSKQQGSVGACSIDELKALDDAYTVSVEAHSVLPEWCFMQSGWTQVQATAGRRRKRRGRR